jgi:hypothetical protein
MLPTAVVTRYRDVTTDFMLVGACEYANSRPVSRYSSSQDEECGIGGSPDKQQQQGEERSPVVDVKISPKPRMPY